MQEVTLVLAIGALIVSLVTLGYTHHNLAEAKKQRHEATRRANIDALADLAVQLRRLELLLMSGAKTEKFPEQQRRLAVALARAAPLLPSSTHHAAEIAAQGEADAVTLNAVLDLSREVSKVLAQEADAPWMELDRPSDEAMRSYVSD